jgi:succinate-semialdehyde dehydrogenase/glutarate-semialdehyde dehydrogenase
MNGARDERQPWTDHSSLDDRCKYILKIAQRLDRNRSELANTITGETGKPIRESIQEVQKSINACRFFAKNASTYLVPENHQTEFGTVLISYQPIGGILVITPWNYPVWQVIRSTVPALLSGNRILAKPSPLVPACTNFMERIIQIDGIPQSSVQFLQSSEVTLERLIASPEVDAVFFTGSTQSGRRVASLAGQYLKKVILELGGSDPYIILEDADLDSAVEACINSRFLNCGQRCNAAKRFIVEAPVHRVFTKKMLQGIAQLKMGDPQDPKTILGPMISHQARQRLHEQIEESIQRGARLLHGGKIPAGTDPYYPPTLLTNVSPGMPVFDEETFGPVAAITRAANVDDAIALANCSQFGLGAAVFTRSRRAAEHVASKTRCGSFAINQMLQTDFKFPFGGTKSSGYGRELGKSGFYESCNIRTEFCLKTREVSDYHHRGEQA